MKETGSGLFFGAYSMEIQKYSGTDFSKKVFLFPGQGSAYPGMYADLYIDNSILQQRFAVADKIAAELNIPMVSPYVSAESIKLNFDYRTRNLALFTLEIGLFEILITKNIRPQLLTAHSFGEYAALVAAGVVSFRDMFEIIVNRDQIIDEVSQPGGMWAVRSPLAETKELFAGQKVFIANQNSPFQTVISAMREDGKRIEALLKGKKIAFLKLDVPHGYHSPLMQDAYLKFSQFIEGFNFETKKPTIPILSFIDQQMITPENYSKKLIKGMIAEQIIKPVFFQEQIKDSFAGGFRNFIEVGPQKILSGFTKEALIKESVKIRTTYDFVTSADATTQKNSSDNKKISTRLYGALNKAFSVVTGYEIESIKMKDRLQEDLGIDSIKKAEIVFKVLEEIGLDNVSGRQSVILSALSTVDDILTYFDREQRASSMDGEIANDDIDSTFKSLKADWKLSPIHAFQKSLLRPLDILKRTFSNIQDIQEIGIAIQDFYYKSDDRPKLVQIIFKPALQMTSINMMEIQKALGQWLIEFSTAWGGIKIVSPWCDQNIHFQFIYDSENKYLAQIIRPYIKSWVLEQGTLTGKIIEVPGNTSNYDNLNNEIIEPYDSFVKYTADGLRYVLDLVPTELGPSFTFKEKGTYLVLGGHRGIGFEICNSIPVDSKPTIIMMGRSPKEDPGVAEAILRLAKPNVKVDYYQCDARDEVALNAVTDLIQAKYGKIDFVFNSAGITISKFVHLMNSDEIDKIITTKYNLTCNLVKIFNLKNKAHVINFSSVAGHCGTPGQAVYSLANAAVNLISELTDGPGKTRFQSIMWGPWKNTGMTENLVLQSFIDIVGLTYIDPQVGAHFAWSMAAAPLSVSCILDENSKRRYQVGSVDKKSFRQIYSVTQTLYLGKTLDVEGVTLQNLPFLRDHKLAGQPIMAASTMIALYAQFGYVLWGQIPRVKNFIGHNFIIIPEASSQLLLNIKRDLESVKLQLVSNFVHSEAEVMTAEKQTLPPIRKKIPKYTERLDNDLLTNSVIELGPAYDFESIVWVDSSSRDVVVEFKISDLPFCTEMPLFDRLYQIIEISHQSLGLTAQWKTGKYSIPKSVKGFELFQDVEVTDRLFSVHDVMTVDEKHIYGDTYIITEKEEVLLKLEGVQFSFLPQDAQIKDRFKFLKEK